MPIPAFSPSSNPLSALAAAALVADEVEAKLARVESLAAALATAVPPGLTFGALALTRGVPARPPRVAPNAVARRHPGSIAGRAALLHAIAHIEFSAIDLALDHSLRFGGLPLQYHLDWLGVAVEEAMHFGLLRRHLRTLGHDYGDFPVHDALWRMAERTADDVLARMALVPRLLEARGLDATPPIQRKLEAGGDEAAARLLDIILRDEVGHVGLGDRWFRFLCAERGLDPEPTFRELVVRHQAPWPQGELNRKARMAAGFATSELDALTAGPPAR